MALLLAHIKAEKHAAFFHNVTHLKFKKEIFTRLVNASCLF